MLVAAPPAEPLRKQLEKRHQAMKTELAPVKQEWLEITDILLPWAGSYFPGDKGDDRSRGENILDNSATMALHTMAAGMMAGANSPARRWFLMAGPTPRLSRSRAVRKWCHEVTEAIEDVLNQSNAYRVLHSMYEELGVFATAAALVLPDEEDVIRLYPITAGEYTLAENDRGEVDTLYREFTMTVAQLVTRFTLAKCSTSVQQLYLNGIFDKEVTVVHAIEPRHLRNPWKRDKLNMPWRSVYFELGGEGDQLLSEGGFDRFPVIAPRWMTRAGKAYGTGCGHRALRDIRQLQHQQYRKAQAIDLQNEPPYTGPEEALKRPIDSLPGGYTPSNGAPHNLLRPLHENKSRIDHYLLDIQDVRYRISRAFHEDLFLMVTQDRRSNQTAREIDEKVEEKMMVLGPVLERLKCELHQPLIEAIYQELAARGELPPPPPELADRPLKLDYVSLLAQAQRAVGLGTLDRLVGNIGAVANIKPEVLDRFDADAWIDEYSRGLTSNPDIIVDIKLAQRARQARAQVQQAQAAIAASQAQAGTALDLSKATTGGPANLLTDVMGSLQGYQSPSPRALAAAGR